MLRRARPPFVGMWVAPGGKLEPTESPWECAIREIHEEAGLVAREVSLGGILREVSPRADWQWLLFAYVVTNWEGTPPETCREGTFGWWNIDNPPTAEMPDADRVFFPRVVLSSGEPYEARFMYDDALRLVSVVEHPSQIGLGTYRW